jgi:hypothetical protein
MYIPAARERVLWRSKSVVFLVVCTHLERQVADLLPLIDDGHYRVEESVPFTELQPFSDEFLEVADARQDNPPLKRP